LGNAVAAQKLFAELGARLKVTAGGERLKFG
jgi:hypothetical protein